MKLHTQANMASPGSRSLRALLFCCLLPWQANAADVPPEHSGDKAQELSRAAEREQLEKARRAASATQEREQGVLQRQQAREWEQAQQQATQKQFDERATREDKYLRQAKDAAAKEHKIPKPKPRS
jgi:septin family protein